MTLKPSNLKRGHTDSLLLTAALAWTLPDLHVPPFVLRAVPKDASDEMDIGDEKAGPSCQMRSVGFSLTAGSLPLKVAEFCNDPVLNVD